MKGDLLMRRTILLLSAIALTLLVAGGVALAVSKVGTNGPDFLKGTNGADNLSGRGDNDRIFGLAGKDNLIGGPDKDLLIGGVAALTRMSGEKTLVGGPGNDAVLGGKSSDNVVGEEGNDYLEDGEYRHPVKDTLSGGDGNDVFGVFNKPWGKDMVTCGEGFDRVFADRKDVVASDCEKVADRVSEFEELGNSIPQSFWEALPVPFGLQDPSEPQDLAKAPRLAEAFEKADINPLVGDWRRKRTCEEYVSRLKQAGLADQIPSHQELVEEFGVGDAAQSDEDSDDPCQGVNGQLPHDHIFFKDGSFNSVNEKGEFVDNDHYKLPNDHTIIFPNSRSESFPPVTAHFRFSDDLNTVTFDLVLPKNLDECSERCRGDYAWAVSVFFSGLPWQRVCQGDHQDNNVDGRIDELGEPCWIDPSWD
jgi:hypothetical protein